MMKIVTALAVLGLAASGRALADGDTSRTTTTTSTERKTNGDGAKATVETNQTTTTTKRKAGGDGAKTTTVDIKSKSDGAAGETTRDEKLTLEKPARPGGNTEVKKDVKTSHKGRGSRTTHRTHVEESSVRDPQGNVISGEKEAK